MGLVKLKDSETGERRWVDTWLTEVRSAYRDAWKQQQQTLDMLFNKTGIRNVSIRTDEDYVKALIRLFNKA